MVLNPLIDLIKTLAERIDKYKDDLRDSESRTRYALIDPLLRKLGWDTEDPDQVRPECSVKTPAGKVERVDYALLEQKEPWVVVEAKKLGIPLSEALGDNINYCVYLGAHYLVNTNGQLWEIYDMTKGGRMEDRRVVTFDVSSPERAKMAAAALFLYRGNYCQIRLPSAVEQPTRAATAGPMAQSAGQSSPQSALLPPTPTSAGLSASVSLLEFKPSANSKPPTIIAPDGTNVSPAVWADLTQRLVQYLWEKGKLTQANCPIGKAQGKRYLIASEPKHPDGQNFWRKRQVGPIWVEGDSGVWDAVHNARRLLRSVGEDPARWRVRG
ncbi:MAG: type I restriction enzyme HsdR N-terminal domain-containing protein [Chloroflexi bacterium]|nr:type I restriction enzyme HsdR N-terminal domain-containing protein [Chloroflexota bacterium]